MEKSYWSFNFLTASFLFVSLAFVISLSLQMLLPIPSDVSTLLRHEVHQYYTRPTRTGPYTESVIDVQLRGQWHPQFYPVGPHLQYDNLWCLQVEVTALRNKAQIRETADWIAVKPMGQPWQLFPLESSSAAQVWEQRCDRQDGK
jgi:hypothetical protein